MDEDAPDDTILYSVVAGRGELIMVGGMRKEIGNGNNEVLNVSWPLSKTISNETYIIKPRYSDLYWYFYSRITVCLKNNFMWIIFIPFVSV